MVLIKLRAAKLRISNYNTKQIVTFLCPEVSMPDGYQAEVEQATCQEAGYGVDGVVGIDVDRREAHQDVEG